MTNYMSGETTQTYSGKLKTAYMTLTNKEFVDDKLTEIDNQVAQFSEINPEYQDYTDDSYNIFRLYVIQELRIINTMFNDAYNYARLQMPKVKDMNEHDVKQMVGHGFLDFLAKFHSTFLTHLDELHDQLLDRADLVKECVEQKERKDCLRNLKLFDNKCYYRLSREIEFIKFSYVDLRNYVEKNEHIIDRQIQSQAPNNWRGNYM